MRFIPLIFLIFLVSCSSAPKMSERTLSVKEAKAWLKKYCSAPAPEHGVHGQMIMRGNTSEFKGQFPASISVEPSGTFMLEVTNIIGGTMAQISGDSKAIQVRSTSKPQYNRSGVESYMGVPAHILVQLVRGELPCPAETSWKNVVSEGSSLVIDTGLQKWAFNRVVSGHGELPGKIRIEPQKIDLTIDEWDEDQNFAKKVVVKTETGNIKWIWKSRSI